MQQPPKRLKLSSESCIADISTSIESIAGTIKSIGDTHSTFLKVNKAVVSYLLEEKRRAEAVNLNITQESDKESS